MPLTPFRSVPSRPFRQVRGFTLIELLTVIAIIGILASILIPTVGKVRESARASQCASNMRSVGVAIMLYAGDNRNATPSADAAGGLTNGHPTSWYLQIGRYLGGDLTSVDKTRRALNILMCPASVRSMSGQTQVPWNGFNNTNWPFISDYGYNYAVNNPIYIRGRILTRFDAPRNPSNTPLLAEMVHQNNFIAANFSVPAPESDQAAFDAGQSQYQRFSQRHGGGSNVLFFDGHIKRFTYAGFVAQANLAGTPVNFVEGK